MPRPWRGSARLSRARGQPSSRGLSRPQPPISRALTRPAARLARVAGALALRLALSRQPTAPRAQPPAGSNDNAPLRSVALARPAMGAGCRERSEALTERSRGVSEQARIWGPRAGSWTEPCQPPSDNVTSVTRGLGWLAGLGSLGWLGWVAGVTRVTRRSARSRCALSLRTVPDVTPVTRTTVRVTPVTRTNVRVACQGRPGAPAIRPCHRPNLSRARACHVRGVRDVTM